MLLPFLPAPAPQVSRDAASVSVTSDRTRLAVSLKDGRYSLAWGAVRVNEATSAVRLGDGRERWANDYTRHVCAASDVTRVNDVLGSGVRVAVHHLKKDEPELVTTYWVYAGRREAYVRVEAVSPITLTVDRMLPIIADRGVDLDAGDSPEVLFVPFDNDAFVRYHSKNWSEEGESYEVGAAYDNASRHGLVVGSVDHDTWKSAVQVRGRGPKRLGKLFAYAGATSAWTRDREPHGKVAGTVVRSPRFSIGAFDDWRDGLESFGRANALVRPAPAWLGDRPVGWNSWSAAKETLNARHVRASLAFFNIARSFGFRYVNMDAFWDFIPEAERAELVGQIHAQGLKAGIYWTPFAGWGDDLARKVEGTNGRYTYRDIALKDRDGNPLPKLDNGWPLDPTHPGTRMRNAWQYANFRRWGFEYVKLDFLGHGSLEGRHHDPKVTTGIQAYNAGMRDAATGLAGMFVSESIAPLFPHGYAHARRMSCDAFADIGQSEYMLNALTYGWWAHGTLYAFNDPDHLPLYKVHNEGPVSLEEGRTRMTSAIAAGGMMLDGDDLASPEAQGRVQRLFGLFGRQEGKDLAALGRSFRPLEGDTGSGAADAFVLRHGDEAYLALFNFSRDARNKVHLDLARAGIGKGPWNLEDLWVRNPRRKITGFVDVELAPKDCALLRLDRRGPQWSMRRGDLPPIKRPR